MRAPFRQKVWLVEWAFAQGEKVTLSPILLGLLRAYASLWGIWLYRCPDGGTGIGGGNWVWCLKKIGGDSVLQLPKGGTFLPQNLI